MELTKTFTLTDKSYHGAGSSSITWWEGWTQSTGELRDIWFADWTFGFFSRRTRTETVFTLDKV